MFSKLPCQVFRHQYTEPTPPWQFRQDQQGSCLPSGQGQSGELLDVPQIWPTPPVTGPVGSLGTNKSMNQNQLFPEGRKFELRSNRQENIRATSSGKWWTIKHLDSDRQKNIRTTSSEHRWTRQHQSYFFWTAMDKTTSELLPLDSNGQDNIRATSSGQRWTGQHQSYFLWTEMDKRTSETSGQWWTRQHQSYFLWTEMDKRTSELLALHSNGQENSRTTSSGQQCTRQHLSYFFWTAMDTEKHTSSSTESEGCWCCSRVTRLLPWTS